MNSIKPIPLILLVTLSNLGNLRASQSSHTSVPSFSASSSSATGSIAQASVSQSLTKNASEAQCSEDQIASRCKELTQLAEEGVVEAYSDIGLLYLEGENGIIQDHKKALAAFYQGDAKGDLWSTFFLGHMYCVGDGVAQDGKRAIQYFESIIAKVPMAADLDISSKKLLGETYYACFYLYESGIGVEKNQNRAFECACKAAQLGHAQAQDVLKEFVQKGDVKAAFFLGTLYEAGQGVEKDVERAFLFYFRAATKQRDTEGFSRACQLVRSGNLETFLTQKLGTTANARRRLMALVRFFIDHTLIGIVECSVCNKEFNSDPQLLEQPLITNPCMHVLCEGCMKNWMSAKGKDTNCPICRTPLAFGKMGH